MTTNVEISNNASTTPSTPVTSSAAASSPSAGQGPALRVIPKAQLYFWTTAWQEMEASADEDLANGDFVDFDDPRDALRWLVSDDD